MGTAEHQSARMSKITNDVLTQSGTGCFKVYNCTQIFALFLCVQL